MIHYRNVQEKVKDFFKKQIPLASDELLWRHIYIMYCISYLLKFNKGFNRSFFEKKDQDETGNGIFFINVVDKIIISNALESITPLKLRNNDKDLLVNAFNKNQQFDYISFFNILTIISKDKPFECTISIFGLCYAMLLAITKTYEDLPSEIGRAHV